MESAQKTPGKTWIDFAKQVYKETGVRGFAKGLQPTLVRAFFMDAISFYGYSLSLHALNDL